MSHSLSWIKQIPAMNSTLNDTGSQFSNFIASDGSGNIYLTYTTTGTVSGGTRQGSGEFIVVAKMNSLGNLVWIKQTFQFNTPTAGQSRYPTIAVHSSGNIYVTSETSGTVSGGTLTGSADIAVFKMDTNGNLIWIRQQQVMNTTTNDMYPCMTIDTSENIYVTYVTDGSVSGGTSGGAGVYGIVVFKMNTNGSMVWIKQHTQMDVNLGVNGKLSVDSSGNVYIVFSRKTGSDVISIRKLDTNGNILWSVNESINNTSYTDITISEAGNIYIIGTVSSTISGGTFVGNADIALFKYNTSGVKVWQKQYSNLNSTALEISRTIKVDSFENIYIAYNTRGTVSGGTRILNNNTDNLVVASLDKDGNIKWILQQLAMNLVMSYYEALNPTLTIDSSGNVYVSYNSFGTVSGGTNLGNHDIVVLKLAPPPPASASAALTENRISAYVESQTTTTDVQKTTLAVDMRTAIKNATYASNAAKAAQQLDYINSMQAKVGASYTVPTGSFASFTATMATVVGGIDTKPVISYFPTFSGTTATINVASVANTNYIHSEVPVGYSVTFQNGLNTVTLTNNGSSYTDGTNTYTTNTSFVLGDKRYTIVGIGSLFINPSNRNVECMVEGTQILTPAGYVPIETLKEGDQVITGTKEIAPISNFHKVIVLRATEQNAPYIIEKDAFGANCPPNRLEVSPRHAIQLEPGLWEMPREAAKDNKRVYQNKDVIGKQVVYYHFSLPNYETDTIVVNGQITECLNDGKKLTESYVWNKQRGGYIRTTKPIEKKNTLSA
jgi:hypothetical protein